MYNYTKIQQDFISDILSDKPATLGYEELIYKYALIINSYTIAFIPKEIFIIDTNSNIFKSKVPIHNNLVSLFIENIDDSNTLIYNGTDNAGRLIFTDRENKQHLFNKNLFKYINKKYIDTYTFIYSKNFICIMLDNNLLQIQLEIKP